MSLPTSFYRDVMQKLIDAGIPFLLGGAYALRVYTDVIRDTKDLDLFMHPRDQERALTLLSSSGYQTEKTAPHWLAKVRQNLYFVDFIFGMANGLGAVDDRWFSASHPAELLGLPVRLIPAEEMICSKAFIMERDRFDGADINHLLRDRGHLLDWPHLVQRFGPHWRVLLSHLILFGFVYPAEKNRIPRAVMQGLLDRLNQELQTPPSKTSVCSGTLLSRTQYVGDLERGHYEDARLKPHGTLTKEQAAQ